MKKKENTISKNQCNYMALSLTCPALTFRLSTGLVEVEINNELIETENSMGFLSQTQTARSMVLG